jgi:hypothetical protein
MKKIAMGNRNKMESKEIRDKWDEYINSMLDLSK